MGWFRRSASGDAGSSASFEERLAAIEPGVPGHCPSCDGLGYIDNLDIGHRFQIQRCKDCGHRWEYLFDADGHVVGLTELDELGQPVARMRVRARPLVADRARAPEPDDDARSADETDEADEGDEAPADGGPAATMIDLGGDDVIDLRAPAPPPEADAAPDGGDRMSPAEWLRHAVER